MQARYGVTTYSVDWDAEGLTQHFARQWWDSGITLAQRPGRHKAPEWMRHKGRPRFQYLEESKQVIRMGVLKAEKTYDPELGKQSTHAGYAVVDELE
jgi:hypothetical protein